MNEHVKLLLFVTNYGSLAVTTNDLRLDADLRDEGGECAGVGLGPIPSEIGFWVFEAKRADPEVPVRFCVETQTYTCEYDDVSWRRPTLREIDEALKV